MNTVFDNLLEPFKDLPAVLAESLDRDGYLILPDMVDADTLVAMRDRFDEILEEEGENAPREHHQKAGVHRIANLVNKGRIFERAWGDPLILACCYHVFGRPFKIISRNRREALLGGGRATAQ